jgi:hypothetical protein
LYKILNQNAKFKMFLHETGVVWISGHHTEWSAVQTMLDHKCRDQCHCDPNRILQEKYKGTSKNITGNKQLKLVKEGDNQDGSQRFVLHTRNLVR